MDESLKRRLVGATVLVSLIVIFVPMLLEDQSGEPPAIEGSNIPPRPEQGSGFASSRVLPLEDEPVSPPGGVPDLPRPESVGVQPTPVIPDQQPMWEDRPDGGGEPQRETAAELADGPLAPESSPPYEDGPSGPTEPLSAVAPSVSSLPEPEDTEPPLGSETPPEPAKPALAKPAPKPVGSKPGKGAAVPPVEQSLAAVRSEPAPAKASTSGWAVQVGSFSERGNADKLVQDLRAARYPAFQEKTEVGGRTLYRVRVGPEEDRDLADAMAAGIAKRFKLNGRVVSYP